MSSRICIDASLGLKLVLAEQDSDKAEMLWQAWIQAEVEVCAPTLYLYEALSAVRGRVYRQLLTPEEGDLIFANVLAQSVARLDPPDLYRRAWNLAKRLNQPKTSIVSISLSRNS